MVLAWPGAEIGVLGARQAVGIIHRRSIEASLTTRAASTTASPPNTPSST